MREHPTPPAVRTLRDWGAGERYSLPFLEQAGAQFRCFGLPAKPCREFTATFPRDFCLSTKGASRNRRASPHSPSPHAESCFRVQARALGAVSNCLAPTGFQNYSAYNACIEVSSTWDHFRYIRPEGNCIEKTI